METTQFEREGAADVPVDAPVDAPADSSVPTRVEKRLELHSSILLRMERRLNCEIRDRHAETAALRATVDHLEGGMYRLRQALDKEAGCRREEVDKEAGCCREEVEGSATRWLVWRSRCARSGGSCGRGWTC